MTNVGDQAPDFSLEDQFGRKVELARFRAADTQVLGVSIDSVHCHSNWARDLGGVSFPLLADFEPKGAVAKGLGHYLTNAGITDRATVIVDKQGIVRYSVSVTSGGERNIGELKKVGGKDQAPCLMIEGKPLYESADLIRELAERAAPLA